MQVFFQKVKELTNNIKIEKQSSIPFGFVLLLLHPSL